MNFSFIIKQLAEFNQVNGDMTGHISNNNIREAMLYQVDKMCNEISKLQAFSNDCPILMEIAGEEMLDEIDSHLRDVRLSLITLIDHEI